jgi:hypothetical protein
MPIEAFSGEVPSGSPQKCGKNNIRPALQASPLPSRRALLSETQDKIERWHQTPKNRILLETYDLAESSNARRRPSVRIGDRMEPAQVGSPAVRFSAD